jgi:prepilin-type processing-associated H-X9-DG protein
VLNRHIAARVGRTGVEALEGRRLLASLDGVVFNDLDRDGARDAGEPPLDGQIAYVDEDRDGTKHPYEPSVTTGADGRYRFERVAGTYRVRVQPEAGWRRTSPSVGFHDVVLGPDETSSGNDFGVAPELSLAGLTLIDPTMDRAISPLVHGQTIDLAEVGSRINVRADVAPGLPAGAVASVRFNLDGEADYRIENTAPYALAGNTGEDYHSWKPRLGTHTLVVTPYGGDGATGEQGRSHLVNFTVIDSTSNPAARPLRVNAGGPAYTTAAGESFAADTGFRGGLARGGSFEVAGTEDDALYSSRRFGRRMVFSRLVANGAYTLKLHFAEPEFERAGRRVFDVFAEGRRALRSFDIVAEAGPRKAVVKQLPVTVSDRRLDVTFLATSDNAIVSAIELIPVSRAPRNPAPVLIDAGGSGLYTDSIQRVFEGDGGFSGGTASAGAFDVEGTADDALFSTHRAGQRFSFSRPVANGNYSVLLGFAEPVAGAAAGSRVFDVFAEGARVLDDYDIVKEAGAARRAVAEAFDVRVTDGSLDLSFRGVAGEAIVSSMVVLPTDIPNVALPYSLVARGEAARRVQSATNLRRIGQAIFMYAQDRRGNLPSDLETTLRYLESHEPFAGPRTATRLPRGEMLADVEQSAWVEGRSDYLYLGAGRNFRNFRPNEPLAYENPARMEGPIHVLFGDGHVALLERAAAAHLIGFDPAPPSDPPVFPDPASPELRPDEDVLASQRNLLQLGRALHMHANENRGVLPPTLGRAYETQDIALSTFVNRRGDTAAPVGLSRDEAVAWVNASSDYVYIGTGRNYATPSEVAIAYENPAEMSGGINLLFADGRVEFREMRWAVETIRRSVAWRRA